MSEKVGKNVGPSYCFICESKASGYHYEVPACNGCKTFFRRTILFASRYQCFHQNTCYDVPPKDQRSKCRSCRFNKCIEVGMNPQAVQTSSYHVESNKLVREICQKRKNLDGANKPSTSTEVNMPISPLTIENQMERMIDQLLYLEFKTENFRKSSYNPNAFEVTLDSLINSTSKLSLADKLGPMPNWPLDHNKFTKTPDKRGPTEIYGKEKARKNWLVFDLMTAVEYTKTFPFFHTLNDKDKSILLRGVAVMYFNLSQAFYSYSNNSDNVIYPDGTNMFKAAPGSNFESLVFRRQHSIDIMIREGLTRSEYVLLKNMIICNPCLTGLSEEGVHILLEQKDKVSKNLLSLCFKECGGSAPSRYATMVSIVDFLQHTSQVQKDMYLLIEIQKSKDAPRIPLVTELLLCFD